MTNLKKNVKQITKKAMELHKAIQNSRVVTKNSFPGYSEFCFDGGRRDDYVSISDLIEQIDEMTSRKEDDQSGLFEDLNALKSAAKVIEEKIKMRRKHVADLQEEKNKLLQEKLEQFKTELNKYIPLEKLTLFRVDMNNMQLETKERVIEVLEEIGFYFARESFNFSIFIGAIEDNKKVQSVKNYINRKIEEKVPGYKNLKSGTSALRSENIRDFAYWLS